MESIIPSMDHPHVYPQFYILPNRLQVLSQMWLSIWLFSSLFFSHVQPSENRKNNVLLYQKYWTTNGILKRHRFHNPAYYCAFDLDIHYASAVPELGLLVSLLIWIFITPLTSLSKCPFSAFKYTKEYRTANANPQNSRTDPLQLLEIGQSSWIPLTMSIHGKENIHNIYIVKM